MSRSGLALACCGRPMQKEELGFVVLEWEPNARYVCWTCGHYLLEGWMDEEQLEEQRPELT